MATRSLIMKMTSDKKYLIQYCHFDGYLKGVGEKLLKYYITEDVIDKIFTHQGGIRNLTTLPENLEFFEPENESCEPSDDFSYDTTVDIEYMYLYKNNIWYVYSENKEDFVELKDAVKLTKRFTLAHLPLYNLYKTDSKNNSYKIYYNKDEKIILIKKATILYPILNLDKENFKTATFYIKKHLGNHILNSSFSNINSYNNLNDTIMDKDFIRIIDVALMYCHDPDLVKNLKDTRADFINFAEKNLGVKYE